MGLGLATKAFFKILFDGQAAEGYRQAMETKELPEPTASAPREPQQPTQIVTAPPQRSDALTVLAALQRESRFIDLIQESLDDYSDQQVGAAARDVLRDASKVIDRMFGIVPLTDADEGSEIKTPEDFDPGRYRLTGNIQGSGPFTGSVAHHGWEASRCEVPSWSGRETSVRVVAPIELEIS